MTPREHVETLISALRDGARVDENEGGFAFGFLLSAADLIEQQAQTIARLRAALEGLRDHFAYGQFDTDTGMRAGTVARCPPSAWKEIRQRVDAALATVSRPHEDAQKP